MKRRFFPLALTVLSAVLPVLAAQTLSFGPITAAIAISGVPFQAERVGRLVHKLANGTTITREVRGRIARDSEGRVLEEEQQTISGETKLPNGPMNVTVLDPVKHSVLTWSNSSQTATLREMSEILIRHISFPLEHTYLKLGWDRPLHGADPDKVTTDDLGQKTISGLTTTGTRTTTVIPIGKLGNDRVLTIVHDVWLSEDLKLAILDTVDDPMDGQQTLEIQDIVRTEPDPAVFRLPGGYETKPPVSLLGGIIGSSTPPSKP